MTEKNTTNSFSHLSVDFKEMSIEDYEFIRSCVSHLTLNKRMEISKGYIGMNPEKVLQAIIISLNKLKDHITNMWKFSPTFYWVRSNGMQYNENKIFSLYIYINMSKTLANKIRISASSALIAFAVHTHIAYNLTNNVLPTHSNNCPTPIGILLHTIVFAVISFLSMTNVDKPVDLKLTYSIYGALLLNFVFSDGMKAVTGSILPNIVGQNNCLTDSGTVLHSLVYGTLLVGMMYLPDA
jgi:hypothetical protein